MFELNPLMQVHFSGPYNSVDLLIEGKTYDISNDKFLRLLVKLTEIVPNSLENLTSDIVYEKLFDSVEETSDAINLFVDMQILKTSSSLTAIKSGIAYWIDHGWLDALILHLSSRNIRYVDDPASFSGEENIEYTPEVDFPDTSARAKLDFLFPECIDELDSHQVLNGIMNRRSFKAYKCKNLHVEKLGLILWHANQYSRQNTPKNIEQKKSRADVFDSAFSALSTYVVIYESLFIDEDNSLDPGIYHYDIYRHGLLLVKKGDFRSNIISIAIGQKRAGKGIFTLLIMGDWISYSKRYNHERGYRNLLINVAELAQYYLILSTMNDLNTFMTPAIQDESMLKLVGIEDTLPLYLVGAG